MIGYGAAAHTYTGKATGNAQETAVPGLPAAGTMARVVTPGAGDIGDNNEFAVFSLQLALLTAN